LMKFKGEEIGARHRYVTIIVKFNSSFIDYRN